MNEIRDGEELIKISGMIEKIVYQNEDTFETFLYSTEVVSFCPLYCYIFLYRLDYIISHKRSCASIYLDVLPSGIVVELSSIN